LSASDAPEQMRLDQHGSPIAAYVSPSNHNDLLSLFGNAAQARAQRSTPGLSADSGAAAVLPTGRPLAAHVARGNEGHARGAASA
jgi:hypothetical protein